MKELLHFAHGNGFPGGCYRQMFLGLESDFDIQYMDRIGHDSMFPVTENWHYLVDEVLSSVRKTAKEPVVAVGHSLGGVLSLLAAIEEPQLFKQVILLDSPLIGPVKSSMVRLAKALGIIDRVTPAQRTRGRRIHWQSREQVLAYLKSRPLFMNFNSKCLNDYIDYGLERRDDGYYLRFDRHIEYQIYRTIPHVLPKFQGQLTVPAALIYGNKSSVVDRLDRRYMHNKFHVQSFEMDGTHLFPFEHPALTAQKIKAVCAKLKS